MRARSWRVTAGSVWESSFLRALGGQTTTSGDPMVLRSMGQFVPLTTSKPKIVGRCSDDRADRLLAWTAARRLTYGEAESLWALDESTAWRYR